MSRNPLRPHHRHPRHKTASPLPHPFVGLVAAYSLWDQARWTPPIYEYTFMLAALGCYPWARADDRAGTAVLNACRLVIAGTYFWAGIHKVNVTFVRETFPWMVQPLVGTLPDALRGWPCPLGLAAALVEAGIGIALLVPATRRIAVAVAMSMHVLILVSIGPLGHRWDLNVWPWNLATPILAALLFWRTEGTGARDILLPRGLRIHWVALILFFVMPALGLVGLWDSYLSAEFYTGAVPRGVIVMAEDVKQALPPEIRRHVNRNRSGAEVLDLTQWAFADRNIEPYPEARVFKATARELCRYAADPSRMTLIFYGKAHWRTGRRQIDRYACADLVPRR